MLPIIVSTIFMNTCLAQLQTFSIQQSNTMNRNLIGFQVPGSSIPVIPLAFMFILIPIYDRICVPMLQKFTGIPTGVTHLQRIGVGLVLSAISMAVAGIIETHRKSVAVKYDMVDSADPLPMSVFWLGFQYAIFGMADMFTVVGLLEFFYAESSAGMKSLGTAISWSSLAFGYFLSSATVELVNTISGNHPICLATTSGVINLNRNTNGHAELTWDIFNFRKDRDVRLKIGYKVSDKIPCMQIRENNWTFNADVNGKWNVRYDL